MGVSVVSTTALENARDISGTAGLLILRHVEVRDEMEDTRERNRGARHIRYAILCEMM